MKKYFLPLLVIVCLCFLISACAVSDGARPHVQGAVAAALTLGVSLILIAI